MFMRYTQPSRPTAGSSAAKSGKKMAFMSLQWAIMAANHTRSRIVRRPRAARRAGLDLKSSSGRQGPPQSRPEGDAAKAEDSRNPREQRHTPPFSRGHLPQSPRVQRGHRAGDRLSGADAV